MSYSSVTSTHNLRVTGANPVWTTIYKLIGPLAQKLEQQKKPELVGYLFI